MEEKDFEPAGLIPRSIIRTVERFRQQLRPETVALAIQEFRISRYQVRVSVRYFFILLFLPVSLNWGARTLIITPLVQYFWNTYSTELFLNTYQAERAFQEMRDFESQLLFEMLVSNRVGEAKDRCSQIEQVFDPNYKITNNALSKSILEKTLTNSLPATEHCKPVALRHKKNTSAEGGTQTIFTDLAPSSVTTSATSATCLALPVLAEQSKQPAQQLLFTLPACALPFASCSAKESGEARAFASCEAKEAQGKACPPRFAQAQQVVSASLASFAEQEAKGKYSTSKKEVKEAQFLRSNCCACFAPSAKQARQVQRPKKLQNNNQSPALLSTARPGVLNFQEVNVAPNPSEVNNKCFAQLFQEKTVLLAEIYNQQSIAAVSNMFGDLVMIISTVLLIRWNAPQFTILKSFLIESFYSFNDAIKSFYIILVTDFLVGFHSPRGWEITMEMLLRHLGLPEDEEFILLFVGTFPVFLDTAFKYWIFRYLNKISPSTVATYHNMIE